MRNNGANSLILANLARKGAGSLGNAIDERIVGVVGFQTLLGGAIPNRHVVSFMRWSAMNLGHSESVEGVRSMWATIQPCLVRNTIPPWGRIVGTCEPSINRTFKRRSHIFPRPFDSLGIATQHLLGRRKVKLLFLKCGAEADGASCRVEPHISNYLCMWNR